MKRSVQVFVVLFGFFALAASGVMCTRVQKRGRYISPYSTFSAGPGGTRALFELSERLGYRPRAWTEDLARLPSSGVLIALGGCESSQRRSLSTAEEENLATFLEGGGVLIVAGADHYLDTEQGIVLDRDVGACPPSAIERVISGAGSDNDDDGDDQSDDDPLARPPTDLVPPAFRAENIDALLEEEGLPPKKNAVASHPLLEGIGEVGMRRPALILLDDEREHEVVLVLDGERAGVRMTVGEGAIVALSSASMFQNRDLAESGGALLFTRLIENVGNGGPVLFDEYHLGLGAQRSIVRYLRELGLAALLLQLLVVIAFFFLRHGRTFGAPLRPAPKEPRGVASYVRSIGKLYARSKDRGGALAVLAQEQLHAIAKENHADGPLAELPMVLARDGKANAAAHATEVSALLEREVARDRDLLAAARDVTRPRNDLVASMSGNRESS